jgi:hypothetical protein
MAACFLAACDSQKPANADASPPPPPPEYPAPEKAQAAMQPVLSVDSVTFQVSVSNPPQVVVTARGMVRTGGWSQPRLAPLGGPVDGVLSFRFEAQGPAPGAMVTQVISPIEAVTTIAPLPEGVKKIRIVAETNELVQPLP